METIFANTFDEIADSLATRVLRAKNREHLTDDERDLFRDAFRAGVTILFLMQLGSARKGEPTTQSLMRATREQIAAWNLPISVSVDESGKATVQ